MVHSNEEPDLLVIGGGINGAGIARDAAGRGLSVTLVEQGDLASATSSHSSKLIHGGLRYLEQYEFRLVREALQEREVMLRLAPHIIRPLMFVLPHDASMRPAWMIRAGLWIYDHLGGPITLPRSKAVNFPHMEFSAGLKPEIRRGFVYSDCRVDDSRLTILNCVSAREKGATILTRTRFEGAKRVNGAWEATLRQQGGETRTIRARALVNAAGPWVAESLHRIQGEHIKDRVRLVKGSHIIVPKVHSQGHALILQNTDKRVVFVIPYMNDYSLIGTTDIPVENVEQGARITPEETDYLVAAANRFLAKPLSASSVVSSYAGVRPLHDDGSANPSEVTRDYTLKMDVEHGTTPLLTVFGGKITTYRRLAEEALAHLVPYFKSATPRVDGHRGAARRRRGALQRLSRRDALAIPGARARARRRSRAPPRLAHADGPRRRAPSRAARPQLRRGTHGTRGRLSRERGMGAHRRGCVVAAHEVRAAT